MEDFDRLPDHDILVIVATKQVAMQNSIDQFQDAQAFCNAAIDERIRYLEVNGGAISKENAKGLSKVCERVDKLEAFSISHEASVRETTRIAAIIAGLISLGVAIASIIFTFWQWGKP